MEVASIGARGRGFFWRHAGLRGEVRGERREEGDTLGRVSSYLVFALARRLSYGIGIGTKEKKGGFGLLCRRKRGTAQCGGYRGYRGIEVQGLNFGRC